MIPTIITPENREHWLALRKKDITSTDVGALFGISPYLTLYELYHRKANDISVDFEETERMKFGSMLEPVIADMVANQQGWNISPLKCYIRNEELRIGSSFDFSIDQMLLPGLTEAQRIEIDNSTSPKECERRIREGILEIKNVDKFVFLDEWTKKDDGNYEAPLHIEIQVQHQLLVSDRKFAYICALVGGNEIVLIKRDRDESVINAIIEKTKWFWQTIADKKEPTPDFAKDAEFISKLYGYAEPDKVMEGGESLKTLATEYKKISEQIKPLEEKKDALKAQMLIAINTAEKVTGDGYNISAKMIGPCSYTVNKKGYRDFRVTFPKPKKEKSV